MKFEPRRVSHPVAVDGGDQKAATLLEHHGVDLPQGRASGELVVLFDGHLERLVLGPVLVPERDRERDRETQTERQRVSNRSIGSCP